MSTPRNGDSAYRRAVLRYLSSQRGGGLARDAAKLLYDFKPDQLGLPRRPTDDQVHMVRGLIDAALLGNAPASEGAPDRCCARA